MVSVLDLRFSRKRGEWRFTTRILASAESPGFRRGVFALPSPICDLASDIPLALWISVPLSQVGFGEVHRAKAAFSRVP